MLLLPVVRHLVDGPTPLHLVEAPSEGTGKTLLADVTHVLATGRSVDPTTLPGRDEEVRKKITAMLLSGPPLILLDNVDRTVDSASLAAVLTRDRWIERPWLREGFRHPDLVAWVTTNRARVVAAALTLALAVELGLWAPDQRGGASEATRFGLALTRRRDRVFGEWRLTLRRDAKRKQNVYALQSVELEIPRQRLGDSP